jgi:uncharacterized protein YhbP (UPF0306 family)
MQRSVIHEQKVMQLATVRDGQPWICTVYFVLHKGNFYWLSFPERRHSKELADNTNAAIAIAIKRDAPVMGIQAEGAVSVVQERGEVETVTTMYSTKYGKGGQFFERFLKGENHHVLYRFVPRRIVRFDEMNHADDPYQNVAIME